MATVTSTSHEHSFIDLTLPSSPPARSPGPPSQTTSTSSQGSNSSTSSSISFRAAKPFSSAIDKTTRTRPSPRKGKARDPAGEKSRLTQRTSPARSSSRATPQQLASTDWTYVDARITSSYLFCLEYLRDGNPTYEQCCRRRAFRIPPSHARPHLAQPLPAWARSARAVEIERLAPRLATEEEFVGLVWGRDLVKEGGVRKVEVHGMDCYLLGRAEFPLTTVCLVGIVVGVDWKEKKVIYHIDDGTAITECTCDLPEPESRPLQLKLEEGAPYAPPPKGRRITHIPPAEPVRFAPGTLVRVVGMIKEGWSASASERVVAAHTVTRLKDPNAEIEHRHLVAKLHRTLYRTPFSLERTLNAIDARKRAQRARQVEEEGWETSSQTTVASSAPGSPSKPKPTKKAWQTLPDPRKVEADLITPANLLVYVKHFILKHYVVRPPADENDYGLEDEEIPRPFGMADLLANKKIAKFAQRLAQRRAQEKRQKAIRSRAPPPPAATKVDAWSKPLADGELIGRILPGSKGGTSGFLPPPQNASPNRKGKAAVAREERLLEGAELDKAAKKMVAEAVKEMRSKGVIILSDPDAADDHAVGMSSVADLTMDSFEASLERSLLASNASNSSRDSPRMTAKRSVSSSAPTAAGPKKRVKPWEVELEEQLARTAPPPPPASISNEDYWIALLEGTSKTEPVTQKEDETPKVRRTVDLNLADGSTPRASKSSRSQRHPALDLLADKSHLSNLSSSSMAATALGALEGETFLLVTVSLLSQQLASLAKELQEQPSGWTAIDARFRLARDERWLAVAECSQLMERARKEAARRPGGRSHARREKREKKEESELERLEREAWESLY